MNEIIIAVILIVAGAYLLSKTEKKKLKVAEPVEASPGWTGDFIKDHEIRTRDPLEIKCFDPATGYSLGSQRALNEEKVKELVQKCRVAQLEYQKHGFTKRRQVLVSILDFVLENKEAICRVSARDTGKTLVDANFGEIIPTLEKLKWTIKNGESCLKTEYRESGYMSFMQSARVEYHPIGVVGLIVSWNYPFHNVISPCISALMAGNGCIIKVSEHVAWSTSYWESIIHAALEANGLSKDLVRLVNGFAEAGQAVIKYTDKVTFIGSPGVGKIVMRQASETLTPVVLELGGKDAAIVFSDCNLKNTLDFCTRACFQNAGQNCAGLERMIVQEPIYETLISKLEALVKNMTVGSSLEGLVDVGAVTMYSQLAKIQDLVDDAVAKGARLVCGGTSFEYKKGQYYQPTILADITHDMKIATEEIFGPVLVLYKFQTEQEAIKLCNSTEFGLGSAVFTMDYEKGERVARQLRVGMCNINGWGVNYLCQSLPFGGVGLSGFDRFAGIEGLRGNCNLRSATTDKFRALKLTTSVPPQLNYPLQENSADFQGLLIDLFYSTGIMQKISSIKDLLVFMIKKSN